MWQYDSNNFTTILAVVGWVILISNIFICRWLHKEGYNKFKAVLNALVILFIAIPGLFHTLVTVGGIAVAAIEGWELEAGIFHYKSAFGLTSWNPYGHQRIKSAFGKIVALYVFGIAYSFFQFFAGFSGGLELIQNIAANMSPNPFMFYFVTMCIAVPFALAAFVFPSGMAIALMEDVEWSDGYLMACYFMFDAGGGTNFKVTEPTHIFTNILATWALALAGAIIGFYGSHPSCRILLDYIQVLDPVPVKTSVTPTSAGNDSYEHGHADLRKPVAGFAASDFDALKNENGELKAQVAELQDEIVRLKRPGATNGPPVALTPEPTNSSGFVVSSIGKDRWQI